MSISKDDRSQEIKNAEVEGLLPAGRKPFTVHNIPSKEVLAGILNSGFIPEDLTDAIEKKKRLDQERAYDQVRNDALAKARATKKTKAKVEEKPKATKK